MPPSMTDLAGPEDHPQETGSLNSLLPTDGSPGTITSYTGQIGDATISMPVLGPDNYSGWDQFFSMVSSGLGNLDGSTMTLQPNSEYE